MYLLYLSWLDEWVQEGWEKDRVLGNSRLVRGEDERGGACKPATPCSHQKATSALETLIDCHTAIVVCTHNVNKLAGCQSKQSGVSPASSNENKNAWPSCLVPCRTCSMSVKTRVFSVVANWAFPEFLSDRKTTALPSNLHQWGNVKSNCPRPLCTLKGSALASALCTEDRKLYNKYESIFNFSLDFYLVIKIKHCNA